MTERREFFPVVPAVWTYLVAAALLVTLGGWAQQRDFYTGMILTEYGLVLGPVLALTLYFRLKPRTALRLKPLRLKTAALVFATVLFSLPITLFLNLLVIAAISWFGKAYDLPIPTADSMAQLTVLFFIISISAGLCEEFFFRGMMLGALEKRFGFWPGIVGSALLFGLFHFNPQNLLGPVFLGLLFGYLVLVTDSLLAGIICHMTNNGVSVLVSYFMTKAVPTMQGAGKGIDMFNQNPKLALLAVAFYGILSAGCALVVFALLMTIRKIEVKATEEVSAPVAESELEIMALEEPLVEKRGVPEGVLIGIPLATVALAYVVVSFMIFSGGA